jgi:hypothetical protein
MSGPKWDVLVGSSGPAPCPHPTLQSCLRSAVSVCHCAHPAVCHCDPLTVCMCVHTYLGVASSWPLPLESLSSGSYCRSPAVLPSVPYPTVKPSAQESRLEKGKLRWGVL